MLRDVFPAPSRQHLIAVPAIALTLFLLFNFAPPGKRSTLPDAARPGMAAIEAQNMQALLEFLASDELEGRGTGQRGLQVAARFLETQYKLAGLQPPPGHSSMWQTFLVRKSRIRPDSRIVLLRKNRFSTSEHAFALYQDFYVAQSGVRSIHLNAPVVFVGFGVVDSTTGYSDYDHVDVRGKIVLALSGAPEPPSMQQPDSPSRRMSPLASRRKKAEFARQAGAAALLLVSDRSIPLLVARFSRWLKRPSFSLVEQQPDSVLPQLVISRKMANAILAEKDMTVDSLRRRIILTHKPASMVLKRVRMKIDIQKDNEILETQNVVAYLPGADPKWRDEVVAIGAHYDHLGITADGIIYNGADDDGSGTAALLEIARAFGRHSPRPKRSLLFISHTGEEKGLLGSRYFTQNPWIPLDRFVAMLNIDMIGRNEENRVFIIGSNFLSKELHRINEMANTAIGLDLDYRYNSTTDPRRFYYRSDHYNYAKHNIPIIFYFTGTHEDYHQPTDTVDKIDFHKMERIARLVYLTAWQVANLDHRLELDGPMAK
ncbi:MAG: M20/M25/M40 family metallo-hydrolase [candidate division KSB1 bacterium]|nr:M20/M25/M40 family metallo-hydrolase [candidate division KSB1 bacterium]